MRTFIGIDLGSTTTKSEGPCVVSIGPVTVPEVMKLTNLPMRHDVAPLPVSHTVLLLPLTKVAKKRFHDFCATALSINYGN